MDEIEVYRNIDDELIRYLIWTYYGGHDQTLIAAIDRSFNDFYSLKKTPDGGGQGKPVKPGQGKPNQ